jgi:uncharacterized phage protein gp47/JayE
MADLPTPVELKNAGQAAFRSAIDPTGTGAVNLAPGSKNDTMLSVLVGLVLRLSRTTADRIAGSRRSSAVDDELDLIGRDLYSQPRKPDAAAVGTAYVHRTGTGATIIPTGSRFQVPPASGQAAVLFQSTADVSVASGITSGVAVPIEAVQTGYSGNVALASLTKILDPLPDATWSLYVPVGPVDVIGGGAPVEDDDTYRARLAQIAIDDTRVRGTRRAQLAAILAVPGVAFATLVEPLDGTTVVYAGDVNYALPNTLRTAIQTALLDVRAYGVPALIRPYNVVTVDVTATLYMARALLNYNADTIKAAAIADVIDYFTNRRPSPDEYYLSAIEASLLAAHPESQDVALSEPIANVQRPADTGYGAVTALNRYVVTPSSISVSIAGPRTL